MAQNARLILRLVLVHRDQAIRFNAFLVALRRAQGDQKTFPLLSFMRLSHEQHPCLRKFR